jgi:2'-5' RNA ligase
MTTQSYPKTRPVRLFLCRRPGHSPSRYHREVNVGECLDGAGRINNYALVFYASGPLAQFLDELRAELEPDHPSPRSHVTVLPPRPIPDHSEAPDSADRAIAQLRSQAGEFSPFRTHVGGVDSFNGTNVVYLSIANGFNDLHRMHHRLNQDALEYDEPYPYHPHITLAQGLTPEQMPAVLEWTRKRWDTYTGPREFTCDAWYFVQATADMRWVDLASIELKQLVPARG